MWRSGTGDQSAWARARGHVNCLFCCMHVFTPRVKVGLVLMAVSSHVAAHELAPVMVTGHYDNAMGTSDAAGQGVVGPELLKDRALLRPADVLEYIPGMVVTQHSGDGKANQYFLRGMNLDHGTDFATTLNGVPLNMPTHAHGQGYTDLNVLIPELVSRVDYRKGPYFASEGDFSSAGSANLVYRTSLARPMALFTVGQRGYLRGLAAESTTLADDVSLLSALERMNNNGPWTVPEGMRKTNAQFILSGGGPRQGWSTSLSAYTAHWHATDQIPQRLLETDGGQVGALGLFDSMDPTDGATTRRVSLSGHWHRAADHALTRVEWYAIQYDLQLYSNFTYSLNRGIDQFAQTDNRTVLGGKATQAWFIEMRDGRSMQNTLGVQWRQDRMMVGLQDTVWRQVQSVVRQDDVQQTLTGVYGESDMGWVEGLRTVAGLRADQFSARVNSQVQAQNSGSSSAAQLSPKLSVILGPWMKTEWFVNAGRGFHSNDARGTTARVDPRTGLPVQAVPGLVSARGQELGVKSQWIPQWQSTLSLWRLDFDSELVYAGDTGNTVAGRASRRAGLEWSNHWTPGKHVVMDANLAWTRPRYTDMAPSGDAIANAMQRVANWTLALKNVGQWSGALGIRSLGSAPLNTNDTVRSASSTTANLRVQRQWADDLTWALDVLNLTDRKNNDISYYYTSRVGSEPPAGVSDLHIHPAEPRTFRFTVSKRL